MKQLTSACLSVYYFPKSFLLLWQFCEQMLISWINEWLNLCFVFSNNCASNVFASSLLSSSSTRESYYFCLREYDFFLYYLAEVRLDWDLARARRSHIFPCLFLLLKLCVPVLLLAKSFLSLFTSWPFLCSSPLELESYIMHLGTWPHILTCRL